MIIPTTMFVAGGCTKPQVGFFTVYCDVFSSCGRGSEFVPRAFGEARNFDKFNASVYGIRRFSTISFEPSTC